MTCMESEFRGHTRKVAGSDCKTHTFAIGHLAPVFLALAGCGGQNDANSSPVLASQVFTYPSVDAETTF